MTQPGGSRLLRVLLVLATFVVLAALAWGASIAVQSYLATRESPAPPPAAQITSPTPAPVESEVKRTAEEVEKRAKAMREKLEEELRQAENATEEEQEPVRVGGEVTAPVKISGDEPGYTEAARRARIQGVVILEATIDRDGAVTSTRVLKGLPMGLDAQAKAAVAGWRFMPAKRRGKPVPSLLTVTVNFRLR